MRLPWWPIYLDARFDEHGVYYTNAGEPEQSVPWHRVRFFIQQSYLVFAPENEQGIQQRSSGTRLFLRMKQKDHPQVATHATAFQEAYLENAENQYACKVDQRSYMKNKWGDTLFLALYAIGFSAFFIYSMIQSYISTPDNDLGVRYQNGILIALIAIILSTLLIYWHVNKWRRRIRLAPTIIEVNQFGVITHESEYPWDTLEGIDQCFAEYVVSTKSGEELLLPSSCCATWIVRNRILQIPVFGYKLFLFFLSGGVLSGPLVSIWFQYLDPGHDLPIGFLGISVLATAVVLVLFGVVYWEVWYTKRRQSKSH